MRKSILAVIAAAFALIGCSSTEQPASPPATSAPRVTQTSTALASNEASFLRSVKLYKIPFMDDAAMVQVGHDVCAMLAGDPDKVNAATALARQSDGMFTVEETAKIVGSAVGSGLCG